MRREFPEAPVVGVGAVVLEGSRVLLVRRGQEPLKGEWSIPGGALELGETLEEGVRREVAEETGLFVEVVNVLEVLDRIVFAAEAGKGPTLSPEEGRTKSPGRVRYHYVLVDFLCRPTGGVLQCATDAEDARWVALEELNPHGIYMLAPATAAVIEKGFAMAAGVARQGESAQ